jgi:glycosyltransferase involved in cell wall biosynthesis
VQVLLLRATGIIRSRVVVHGDEFTFWEGRSLKRALRRAVIRWTFAHVDGYACINSLGPSLARSHGLPAEVQASALPAIVPDPTRFKPGTASDRGRLRRDLSLPQNKAIVAYIGRLEAEKGVLDLISAASDLGDDLFLAVWGTGSIEGQVQKLLKQRASSGRFFGPLDLEQVAKAMRASDIVVVPSRAEWNEQFGRVVVEAMACGCAVIATRSGALPEVVGDAGMLVEANDVSALRQAIHRLITDEEERLRVGALGRKRALEHFAPSAVARRMCDYWTGLLDPSATSLDLV